jgi:tetratricopeptide (TPR) repeat protein
VIRFGDKDERILALKGLVKEAEATNNSDLEKVLEEYEVLLELNGSNIVRLTGASLIFPDMADMLQPIHKRRIALLRSMGKVSESISALNSYLDFSPTDSEAWAELADMYLSQGLYSQTIYALEEVLVLMPNAWNVRHRHSQSVDEMMILTTLDSRPSGRSFINGCQHQHRGCSSEASRRGPEAVLPEHRVV